MNNDRFLDYLNRLNSNQRLAVETIEGPVMVIAGPGTGKTQTLTLRVANILRSTQVNPENILALTFTDSAVYEMRQRLISIIGNDAYRVGIYTFHSFCDSVIKQHNEEFEDLLSASSISELKQIQIVEELLSNNTYKFLKPLATPLFHAKSIVHEINTLKRERVTPSDLARAIDKDETEFNAIDNKYHEKGRYKGKMKGEFQKWEKRILKNRELVTLFEGYEEYLSRNSLYDFNDMILKVVAMLEKNDDLLLRLQERYQYILVDEHQDTNTAQNTLIEQLGSYYEVPNLFIVGDEKQAIFRFQGASLENFLYFKERYPTAILINLQNNYRSSQTILDASLSLIEHSSIPLPSLEVKLMASAERINVPIQVAALETYFSEYAYIAADLKQRATAGQSLRDIAVISRTNKDLFELARFLEHEGVPFSIDSDQNVLKDPVIEKLIVLLRSILLFPDDPSFVQLMHLDILELYPIDVFRIIRYAKENQYSIWECFEKHLDDELLELNDTKPFKTLFGSMQRWQRYTRNLRLDDALIRIINESAFLPYCMHQVNAFECMDKMARLFQEIRINVYDDPAYSLAQFIEYMDLLKEHNLSLKVRHIVADRNAVQLITAHKAKGREYDHVYVTQTFDGHWGSSRTKSNLFTIPWNHLGVSRTPEALDSQLDDERRLFYVALTRARHGITITYANHGLDGKEQTPSQFIEEIVPSYRVPADIAQFSAAFEEEKNTLFFLSPQSGIEKLFADNRPYFRERLRRKGISVTDLNNYLTCPWRYFFRNLIQIPETKVGPQLFGTAVHVALSKYITARKEGSKSVDVLLGLYANALERQPFMPEEREGWLERGQTALRGFYEERILGWHDNLESELSIPGVLFEGDIFLTGTLDMVEITSATNEVTVYDFKTGTPKSRNVIEGKAGKGNGEYKRQLVYYKLLLDTYKRGFYRMTSGVIEFVEPTDSGTYRHEEFEISSEDLEWVRTELRLLCEDVSELAFWNRYCDEPDCFYCKLRRSMSSA